MIWLFLTVVLLLIVFHPRFRSIMGWLTGACALVALVIAGVLWYQNHTSMQNGGFDLSTARPVVATPVPPADLPQLPPGFILDCPKGQQSVKDTLTGAPWCYNSHDASQLAEHLKECGPPKLGDPYQVNGDRLITDRRGIPCNVFDKFDNDCPAPPATPWPGCASGDEKPLEKYRATRHAVRE